MTFEKRKEKILIIYNDADRLRFIKDILKNHCEMISLYNTYDTHDKIIELMPDLIISDGTSRLNGMELCRKIKHDIRTNHIPVILLSGERIQSAYTPGTEVCDDASLNKLCNSSGLISLVQSFGKIPDEPKTNYIQSPVQIKSNANNFLHLLIKYLDDNMDDPCLNISGLASKLNMSSSNLYRKIKFTTGMSPIDFIIHHKMKFAAHLLSSGTRSVKEVAYMTGFNDARYFSTRFKKYFTQTPTEYIQMCMATSAS